MTSKQIQCDVLVVGSGAAGLAAALKAAKRGLEVVVVEKEPYFGGTTSISAGWAWLPGNKAGVALGDTRESQLEYLRNLSPEHFNEEGVTNFLDSVPEAVEFLESVGIGFVYPDKAPDYQMDLPGARLGGRAILPKDVDARVLGDYRMKMQPYLSSYTVFGYMPQVGPEMYEFFHANQSIRSFVYVAKKLLRSWWDTLWFRRPVLRSNGSALMTLMVKSALDAGVQFLDSTSATRLTIARDGRVAGAQVEGKFSGNIIAAKGVILASGGFSGDPALRAEYFSHDAHGGQHFTPTIGHDGDAVRLVSQVGGWVDAEVSSPGSWAPVTVFHALRDGRERLFPHLRQIGLPGLIAVDQRGHRFGNEALSYHDFGRQMIDHCTDAGQTRAWLIADSKVMRKYGIGYAKPWPLPRGYFYRAGYLVKGRTLEELASKIGVDAAGLRATVESFNKGASIGVDESFGRGSTEYNHFRGDPEHLPNPNLAELDRAPFYAAEMRMGDLGTFAGVAVDGRGRVIGDGGAPILGLYAAGAAAVSVFGGGYPGYGSHIGPALVFGYRAGRDIGAAD